MEIAAGVLSLFLSLVLGLAHSPSFALINSVSRAAVAGGAFYLLISLITCGLLRRALVIRGQKTG